VVASPVEAVWVWYYGGSNQKWTYGRYKANGFTKDHLQINADAAGPIQSIYGLTTDKDQKHELQLKWPNGGELKGSFMFSSTRFVLRWDRPSDSSTIPWRAPEPWRMVPNPDDQSVSPLRGNGTATTDVEALAAIEAFNDGGSKAYLVAVKLKGENNILHVRAYLKEPDPDLKFASTDLLPRAVQALVDSLNPDVPSCASRILGGRGADKDVADAVAKLEENPNLLLIGPPGTGKSVLLDKLVQHVTNPNLGITFDPNEIYDAWDEPEDLPAQGKASTVVLHPSYSYDNLVVGLLPKVKGKDVQVGVTTGPLVNLAHYGSSGNQALLVLDEFNRGNAAAILGDTLALLDKDKRDVAHVDLPAYGLPMDVPEEFAVEGGTRVAPRFSLPRSLWIVAAMNSSDRSVAPLDAALRRRFSIVEIGPDYELLGGHLGAVTGADFSAPWDQWTPGLVARLAVELLRGINARIEASLGRDFLLGHSNLWHVFGDTPETALLALASAWDLRIVQTMRLALQDDDDTLAFIFSAGKSNDATETSSRAAWWKKADAAHDQFARPRLNFNLLSGLSPEVLHAEIKRLAGA
jgi:5-methylcytosine-specific restriction protein B